MWWTIWKSNGRLAESRSKRAGQPELPLPQQQQTAQRAEARLHKVRKELREILSIVSTPTPQLHVKDRERERERPAPAAKTGLFEL